MMPINTGYYGEKLYEVKLGTGTAWVQTYEVYAYHEQEAIDIVADFCEQHQFKGFYYTSDEITNEYAEANGLICCGNHGIYMQVIDIQEAQK